MNGLGGDVVALEPVQQDRAQVLHRAADRRVVGALARRRELGKPREQRVDLRLALVPSGVTANALRAPPDCASSICPISCSIVRVG